MTREQFDHLVRAAARICGAQEVVIIGTAALHGIAGASVADELRSVEQVDLFVPGHPESSRAIEAALGQDSMYHEQHRVHARAVGPLTPVAPAGWRDRLVALDLGDGVVARCMEVHDLLPAKLVAGRGKDLDVTHELLERAVVDHATLLERIELLDLPDHDRERLRRAVAPTVD